MKFPAAIVLILSAALFGCTEPSNNPPPYANNPPQTRLSNVPPPGLISTSPLLTLSWLGDDADGYIVAYRYRWSFRLSSTSPVEYKDYTYILNITVGGLALIMMGDETVAPAVYKFFATLPPEGLDTTRLGQLARGDTLTFANVRVFASNPDAERYPTHEAPSRGTFIFDSQDTLNPHTFEVSAIDNMGAVDPSPAEVNFFTPKVSPPDVEVVGGPALTDTVIILNEFTDTYDGIEFSFQGTDPNSRTIEYSWIIDRDEWPPDSVEAKWSPFSLNPRARIKGSDIPNPYATSHRIYARARNEFGSISERGYFVVGSETTWAYRDFYTVYPKFAIPGSEQRILLLLNVFDWDTLAILPYRPSRSDVRDYYVNLYNTLGLAGKYDIFEVDYNVTLSGTWPGLGLLGEYSLVHVVADAVNAFNRIPTIANSSQVKMIEYCNAGGKLMINGWNLTRGDNLPANPDFLNNIIHILRQVQIPISEFAGARHQDVALPPGLPLTQYPDAPLDMTKLDSSWGGALPAFNIFTAYGFGEILYRYDALNDNALVFPQNQPPVAIENGVLGTRYLGLTYDVIFLGFPLYYIQQDAALEILRRSFQDLRHL